MVNLQGEACFKISTLPLPFLILTLLLPHNLPEGCHNWLSDQETAFQQVHLHGREKQCIPKRKMITGASGSPNQVKVTRMVIRAVTYLPKGNHGFLAIVGHFVILHHIKQFPVFFQVYPHIHHPFLAPKFLTSNCAW